MAAREPWISCLMIVALSSVVAGSAPTYLVLVFARASAGVGSAFYIVSPMSQLARLSESGKRGKMMGMYSSLVFTGIAAGPVLGGFVAACYGIHSPFHAYAFLTTLGVVFAIPLQEPSAKNSVYENSSWKDMSAILGNRSFVLVSFAVLALFFLQSSVKSTMIPLYASINVGLDASPYWFFHDGCYDNYRVFVLPFWLVL